MARLLFLLLLLGCGTGDAAGGDGSDFCARMMPGYAPPRVEFGRGGDALPSFRDATAALGLPTDLHAVTSSVGDLNRDGNLDILVWEKDGAGVKEAYLNCGSRFLPLGLAGRIDGAPADLLGSGASASVLRDLDGDGRTDLVVATLDTRVHVLLQQDGLRFSHRLAWAPPAPPTQPPFPRIAVVAPVDINGDGRLDLYAAFRLKVDMPRPGAHAENRVLLQQPDGSFADATMAPEYAPIFACGDNLTLGVNFFLDPRPGNMTRYIWLGNINADSCLYRYSIDAGRPSFRQVKLPLVGDPPRTMGVEHAYEDNSGASLVTESNWGLSAPTFRIADSGVTDVTGNISFDPVPADTHNLISWGMARRDFDNDGFEDLAEANGSYFIKAVEDVFFAGTPGLGPQYLQLYRNDGTDHLKNESAGAGAPFATPGGGFSLAAGDLDHDGCYDLLATPKDRSRDVGEYDNDAWDNGVRVLLNSCSYSNDRLGLVLPDDAVLVTVEGSRPVNGTTTPFTRYRGVKPSPGIASGSDRAYMIVGLGRGASVRRVTVTTEKAGRFASFSLDGAALKVNAYNDVRAPR